MLAVCFPPASGLPGVMQWDSRVERLGDELFSAGNIPTRVGELLDQVADELKDRELKALKEDMAALADGGGLQGKGLMRLYLTGGRIGGPGR